MRESAEALSAHLRAAPVLRSANRVAAYVPIGSEPGSIEAIEALRAEGVSVLLPVVRDDGDLDWSAYLGPLVPARFGLREPPGPRLGPQAIVGVEAVLVPAMAADRLGNRLGSGRGFYDRAMTRLVRPVPVIALLHDGELVDSVPAEPHDQRVSVVVTPALGWVEVGPGWTPE